MRIKKAACKTGVVGERKNERCIMEFSTLRDVLVDPERYRWTDALYLSCERSWDGGSRCLILDPEETDDPDDDPILANENGLQYVLSMQDVQSIVRNAKRQKIELSEDELIRALDFYFANDAYIVFP